MVKYFTLSPLPLETLLPFPRGKGLWRVQNFVPSPLPLHTLGPYPQGFVNPWHSLAGMGTPKAITVRGKVLLPRSPQPAQTNRNTHPGMVAMPRAKRTSAEVNAFAKNKANLRQ